LDQLADVKDARAQKMFGEYALYVGAKVVALVCDDQLFVKITGAGKALVGKAYKEGFAYPGAKPSILVAADDIEDSERLSTLIRATAAALPAAKPKAKSKAKSKPKSKTTTKPSAASSATTAKAKRRKPS